MAAHPERESSLLLWGVGDHGGGASRADLKDLSRLMEERKDFEIRHSYPEAYFELPAGKKSSLPRHARDMNPWAVGCYTSMARVKQKHRLLENDLFLAEKMAAAASYQGLMPYPREELGEAQRDLAFSQFHDILPGSAIPQAEESSVRRLDHGLEILSRVKARSFFALAGSEPTPAEGEIPLFVHNPHPFKVRGIISCEFQPYEINAAGGYLFPQVYSEGRPLPSQPEKEASNLNVEWRKKVTFAADLEPGRINRFVCRPEMRTKKPVPVLKEDAGKLLFRTDEMEFLVNTETGLVDRYRAAGRDFLAERSFAPLVIHDSADPWGMTVRRFRDVAGRFELASPEDGSRVSGITARTTPSVRVVEDGAVRAVIESVLTYGRSVVFLRYMLPRTGTEIELEARVHWAEKDKMLKLSVPTLFPKARYVGQTAYGVADLPGDGDEAVAQKWVAAVSDEDGAALTVVNDCIYGSDFADGEVRLSLLRSAAYSADPVPSGPMVAQDRFVPRLDQGERVFRFWINGGDRKARLTAVDREATARNEKPFCLAFFPSGKGKRPRPFIHLSDHAVGVAALKKAEKGESLIIRLFEPTGEKRTTVLSLPWARARKKLNLSGFEIKTLSFNPRSRAFRELDLLERPVRKAR